MRWSSGCTTSSTVSMIFFCKEFREPGVPLPLASVAASGLVAGAGDPEERSRPSCDATMWLVEPLERREGIIAMVQYERPRSDGP